MERMTLVLLPDETQRQALEDLLAAQQDPASPWYQRWLAPEEFGARFGVSEGDLDRIVSWLEAGGFTVEPPPASRCWAVFSGTAGHSVGDAYRLAFTKRCQHAGCVELRRRAAQQIPELLYALARQP